MGMYADTIKLIKELKLSDVQIEEATGLPKRWINKFRNDQFSGNMVSRIEQVFKYAKKEQKKAKRKEAKKCIS